MGIVQGVDSISGRFMATRRTHNRTARMTETGGPALVARSIRIGAPPAAFVSP